MPRKSTKTTSTIISGVLYTDDSATGATVGSAQWFTWLQQATMFYYEGSAGTFTARRETKQRGGVYWTAYRRSAGKLSKRYLGKPEALTADRLAAVAGELAASVRTAQRAATLPTQDAPPTTPTPILIALDWKERDALRYAALKPEIFRDSRTKRGVHSLCLLGLLVQTRTTETRAYYALTEAGRAVAEQLPTPDEEWADMRLDSDDPAKLSHRRYSAEVDPRMVARLEADRECRRV